MPAETPGTDFEIDIRVYYEDTDAAGVVFYANYLKFFERGRTEWLRKLGVSQSELAAIEHRMFVVKNVDAQYRKPAKLDDLVRIQSRITRVGPASVDFQQSAHAHGVLLCDSAIKVCCVDTRNFRPAPLPESLRTLLEKVQN